jgi:hypothetical protein
MGWDRLGDCMGYLAKQVYLFGGGFPSNLWQPQLRKIIVSTIAFS